MAATTRYTIGIDIGGTFTDVVLMASDGTVTTNKAPTTPHDFSIGVIDAIRDTIGTAIQVNLSMVTIEESETTKRLAAWAAIFAVSTALAGIWGMNFEHMPELKWAFGYPMALGLIASAAGVLFWRFRRAGWL